VRNFTVVTAARAEKQKGRGRGRRGVFIAAARRRLRQAIKELKRGGSNGRDLVSRRDLRTEEGEDLTGGSGLTGGVHAVSERKRNRGYRFGFLLGLRADFPYWAESLPRALFWFFLLFHFSFFYFFHIFCKNVSNQFKPNSKFFQYSKQGFKPI
jgi:hypothetical protein